MIQPMTILSVASLLLIVIVLRSVRGRHVRVEYCVSWLMAGVSIFVLSLMPGILGRVARWAGIEDLPLALVLLILTIFLGVFYRFSAVLSDLKDMNIALAQKVAMLEYELTVTNEEIRRPSN